MKRTDLSAHRILILGAKTHSMLLLRSILGNAGITQIVHVGAANHAIEMLGRENFTAVFYDPTLEDADARFAAQARRADCVLNPMIPIFALKERARRRDVETARDIGVTDVLTMPVSPNTVLAKLRAAPRPFILAQQFVGPDRRSKSRAPWHGADRRTHKARKAKVDFHTI